LFAAIVLLFAVAPCVMRVLSFEEGKTTLAVAVAVIGAVAAAERKPGAAVDKLLKASPNLWI
jgi:hypothetical protein